MSKLILAEFMSRRSFVNTETQKVEAFENAAYGFSAIRGINWVRHDGFTHYGKVFLIKSNI